MKCKKHPYYKGVRKSKTNCEQCDRIYEHNMAKKPKYKSIKELTEEDKEILLKTREDSLLKDFEGYKRDDLRALKRELLEERKRLARVDAFREFLSVGRLEQEIRKEFGSLKLLSQKFDGLNLFRQRNEYNENIYILLPEIKKDYVLEDKKWTFHRGTDKQDGESVAQPYLMVQMPQTLFRKHGTLEVYPIYDVHYGHSAHKLQKLLSYVQWIAKEDNRFAIIGGDLIENALDDARGMTYDQSENPDSQMTSIIKILAPIAHKILVAIPGNHEWRTYKKSNLDPMRFIANELDVPYFDGPVFLSILGNGHKWRTWVHHGRGNSQTKGGKLNAAGKSKKFLGFIEFDLSGHVHDPISNPETFLIEDPANCRLVYKKRWTVIAPSFLRWENTYAYRAEYGPPGSGGVLLEMHKNGDYRAVFK